MKRCSAQLGAGVFFFFVGMTFAPASHFRPLVQISVLGAWGLSLIFIFYAVRGYVAKGKQDEK